MTDYHDAPPVEALRPDSSPQRSEAHARATTQAAKTLAELASEGKRRERSMLALAVVSVVISLLMLAFEFDVRPGAAWAGGSRTDARGADGIPDGQAGLAPVLVAQEGCAGLSVSFAVDIGRVQGELPPGWRARPLAPGLPLGEVSFLAVSCPAAQGRPLRLAWTSLAIEPMQATEDGAAVTVGGLIPEVVASDAPLLALSAQAGGPVLEGQVAVRSTRAGHALRLEVDVGGAGWVEIEVVKGLERAFVAGGQEFVGRPPVGLLDHDERDPAAWEGWLVDCHAARGTVLERLLGSTDCRQAVHEAWVFHGLSTAQQWTASTAASGRRSRPSGAPRGAAPGRTA